MLCQATVRRSKPEAFHSRGLGMIAPMSATSDDEPIAMLPVREEQRQMTRNRITAAARRAFEEHGYSKASIGDITKAANVNRATFYLHFMDKAAVFNEVYAQVREQETRQYWTRLGEALAEGTETAIRTALDDAFTWWEEHAALLPAIHEAMASDLDVAARWKENLDRLADELHSYLGRFPEKEREGRRLRVELMVMQLDQLCFRVIVQKVVDIDREVLLDVVCDLWLDALQLRPVSTS